jgi:PAS domain S-box-containing protein
MGKGKTRAPLDLGNLRRRAEERWLERQQEARAAEPDLQRLVHELEVHQIELEMQNDELREARVELEAALARYTEIFEYAPIGYTTISLDGTVHEINHAAARLLGRTRSQLHGRPFDSFVVPRDRGKFSELLRLVVENDAREACELELFCLDSHVVRVQLLASVMARAEPVVLLAVEDIRTRSAEFDAPQAESGVVGPKRSPVAI